MFPVLVSCPDMLLNFQSLHVALAVNEANESLPHVTWFVVYLAKPQTFRSIKSLWCLTRCPMLESWLPQEIANAVLTNEHEHYQTF